MLSQRCSYQQEIYMMNFTVRKTATVFGGCLSQSLSIQHLKQVNILLRTCSAMIAMALWLASANMAAASGTGMNVPNDFTPSSTEAPPDAIIGETDSSQKQTWNVHAQNTDIVQGYPGFSADYSGPNSLPSGGETRETTAVSVYLGCRLWSGASAHMDAMMWQGFGLGDTVGIEDFPNGEAYKTGTSAPNGTIARLFIRQTIGLGGRREAVHSGDLHLAGMRDVSRITITIGRFSAADIFDTNAYANDPKTQFMNWAFINNVAWDYPADALGYTTGVAVVLNQPKWALSAGFFQMPGASNSNTAEDQFLVWPAEEPAGDGQFWHSWETVVQIERRYRINKEPGAIRFLAYLNSANMGNYQEAVNNPARPADITATQAYRLKYGFGLNWQQAVSKSIGIFSRLGWSDGRNQAWTFTDANYTASLGLSIKGQSWGHPDDTFGLAGVLSGISRQNQRFLEAGGTGILDGDGALSYGWEKAVETYYSFKIFRNGFLTLDYQFIADPAFNSARGPVSVFGLRWHWSF